MTESKWVQILKTILLAISALGYTWPLITGMGHVVVPLCVILASILAYVATKKQIRISWCIVFAFIFILIGIIGNYLTLNTFGFFDVAATIQTSRFWYYAGLIFGIIFLTRNLSLRYRTAQIIESALLIGTLVYLFFAHRDFNLTHPREFADYLYSNGYDPIEIYRWMGLGAAFLSLPLLLGKAKIGKTLYSFLTLILLVMLLASFSSDWRLPSNIEDPLGLKDNDEDKNDSSDNSDNQDDDQNDDQNENNNDGDGNSNNNGGGGGGSQNQPSPVAIAVFYDEFEPADGIFHFRQNVLSRYDGNHLVTSDVDTDVISTFPSDNALIADSHQNADMSTKVATSMFLFVEHPTPPQLSMAQRIYPVQNPDPKLYISAYGVESLGMTMDITRLIGRHSIPADWSSEKVEHYLKIPDDPRYRALSDIIVRQIDPRFAEDDIVKAIYIKAWLEHEGYYTQKTKHIDKKDPTASFLFGSMRGYCVHFAHAAVYLLRSQGIAARVAQGYAVDNNMRGTNSAVLILGDQAHAWPEIYVDGVGWVTLEIFPENGDEPPRAFVDRELESLFGEMARNDKSGGKSLDPLDHTFTVPWRTIWQTLGVLLILLLLAAYARKISIILIGYRCTSPKELYRPARGAVFTWRMFGHNWLKNQTLESFARDTVGPDSATLKLIRYADAAKLGSKSLDDIHPDEIKKLYKNARSEAYSHSSLKHIILGYINPWVML